MARADDERIRKEIRQLARRGIAPDRPDFSSMDDLLRSIAVELSAIPSSLDSFGEDNPRLKSALRMKDHLRLLKLQSLTDSLEHQFQTGLLSQSEFDDRISQLRVMRTGRSTFARPQLGGLIDKVDKEIEGIRTRTSVGEPSGPPSTSLPPPRASSGLRSSARIMSRAKVMRENQQRRRR